MIIHVYVLVSKLPESRDHESFIAAFPGNFQENNKASGRNNEIERYPLLRMK